MRSLSPLFWICVLGFFSFLKKDNNLLIVLFPYKEL